MFLAGDNGSCFQPLVPVVLKSVLPLASPTTPSVRSWGVSDVREDECDALLYHRFILSSQNYFRNHFHKYFRRPVDKKPSNKEVERTARSVSSQSRRRDRTRCDRRMGSKKED